MKPQDPHPRARLVIAFVLSLAVALAAFQFAQELLQRVVILFLAFVPFVGVWYMVRK